MDHNRFAAARNVIRLGMVAGAGVIGLFVAPLGAGASTGSTTFKFTGSLKGTLSQANTGCTGAGGQFEFFSVKLKGSSDNTWTVSVNALNGKKKGGTYKTFGGITGNGVSIVLDGTNGKTASYWASKSGTLTTSPGGGRLNVLLVPDRSFVGKPGKGNVRISGSWGCTLSAS
jgi:hypothetical protein